MGLFILHPRASPEKAERIANIYQESRDNYAAVSRMNQSSETKKSKANKHSIRHHKTHPISESTSLLYESTQSTTVSNDSLTLPTSIFAEDYKNQNHRWHRRRIFQITHCQMYKSIIHLTVVGSLSIISYSM